MLQNITRTHKEEAPLVIPNSLQKELPFKFKPKAQAKTIDTIKRIAIVKDPKERKVVLSCLVIFINVKYFINFKLS